MNLSRRMLLGAAMAGGAVAAVGLPLSAARATAAGEPVRLLVGGHTPSSFVESVRVGLGGMTAELQVGGGMDGVAWLQAAPGRRLIGLMDTADAVLVQQLARDGRLRWLASGHHSQSLDDHRHGIDSLPASHGLAAVLGQAKGDWAPVLGLALGQIAAGRWQTAETTTGLTVPAPGGKRRFALASFVIAS